MELVKSLFILVIFIMVTRIVLGFIFGEECDHEFTTYTKDGIKYKRCRKCTFFKKL